MISLLSRDWQRPNKPGGTLGGQGSDLRRSAANWCLHRCLAAGLPSAGGRAELGIFCITLI